MSSPANRTARERILAAAVGQIAREGIDGVRIARIAMEARVSSALVHYHFETRDALLAEALDYSYQRAGEARIAGGGRAARGLARRASAVDDRRQPADDARPDRGLGAVGRVVAAGGAHPDLRPVAEDLYARMHAWFRDEIAAGVRDGEWGRCDPDEVADRALALIDGYGIRTLIGDCTIPLDRERQAGRVRSPVTSGSGTNWLRRATRRQRRTRCVATGADRASI